jgi:hypothetical protein
VPAPCRVVRDYRSAKELLMSAVSGTPTKACSQCDTCKPLDEFRARASECNQCNRSRQSESYHRRPDSHHRARVAQLWSLYRLREEDYLRMKADQSNLCPVCGDELPADLSAIVDHDHNCCPETKTCGVCVRALLHTRCNTLVGYVEKQPAHVQRALSYIERTR